MKLKHTLIAGLILSTLTVSLSAEAATRGKAGVKPQADAPAVAPSQPLPAATPSNAQRIEQVTGQAVQAYQAGDFAQAATHFKTVVKLDPNNEKAWLFLGKCLAQSGDNMGARRAFFQVLSLQSAGAVADAAHEQLAKLPEPDLFQLQLDSGLTLGDWLPIAQQQAAQGKREAVLGEIAQHLRQFGPVPQLMALQEKLNQAIQAEQEQRLQSAIAALKVKDAETAQAALPQIRALRKQAPSNLTLLSLEAKACHFLQNWAGAEAAYSAWLKVASGNDVKRKDMVAGLMQAKQHEALPPPPKPFEMVVIPGKNYELGKYEVTQDEWQSVMGSPPPELKFTDCGDTCPVENVSWNDIQEFIQKLNAQTGKTYRLPTEIEWQTACLAGSQTEYCGGNDLNAVAWYDDNSGKTTHPVGQKQANAYGLYDMSGNVWEWMQDCWDSSCGARVLRGGSWSSISRGLRAAFRSNCFVPSNRDIFIGFRLARTLP